MRSRFDPISPRLLRAGAGAVVSLRDDRGGVLLIVAICIVVVFGAAALSIDAGGAWTLRRDLVTDTDAASLAAARSVGASGPVACAEAVALGEASAAGRDAVEVFAANRGAGEEPDEVTFTAYNGDCTSRAGRVRVAATESAETPFARVMGIGAVDVRSASLAQWGPLSAAVGIRPIAVCVDDPHVREWVLLRGSPAYAALAGVDDPSTPYFDHPSYAGAGVVHRVVFERSSPAACGASAPGNWGWLDFDGEQPPSGASALRERLLRGFPGVVTIGDAIPGDEDCRAEAAGKQDCPGETGANASTEDALRDVTCPAGVAASQCRAFPIVVYDSAGGTGSNAEFHPAWFLGVVLRGYFKVTGTPKPDSSFDLELVELDWPGTIGPRAPQSGVYGVQLCGVDDVRRCDV